MQMKKMLSVLACALISSPALAVDIVFLYDENNSFFTEERLGALERAASAYESYITNDLNIIVTLDSEADMSALARGGTSIVANFQNDWKGTITFSEDHTWYSGIDESFSGIDLYSVAIHELGHVLGVGIVNTWRNLVSGNHFYGENATSVYGGPVPLDAAGAHWLAGVESTLPGTETWQQPSYTPALLWGTRQYLTDLDLAGLADIGWSVSSVPEPEMLYLLLSGLGIVGLAARRHRRTV